MFKTVGACGAARAGIFDTPRGPVLTPTFMPVGTKGSVKALVMDQVQQTGAQIVLANTYHLLLRPGPERLARLGGLNSFMGWKGPILTDSGGFQVMSLAHLRRMDEQGVTFRSHIDGAALVLTPESAIEAQCLFGSTIIMALDQCTNFQTSPEQIKMAMERSLRWAARSKDAFLRHANRDQQLLFGICQGGTDIKDRLYSTQETCNIGFDGYAIGGLALGEGHTRMMEVVAETTNVLPSNKPRYLMGVGTPLDLIEAVARGVDMFDCVMPTRAGRHGLAFTSSGKVNLRHSRFADSVEPLDDALPCPASRDYSRGYLHHLVKEHEILASTLITWNNIFYYQWFMRQIRSAILDGTLDTLRAHAQSIWGSAHKEPALI